MDVSSYVTDESSSSSEEDLEGLLAENVPEDDDEKNFNSHTIANRYDFEEIPKTKTNLNFIKPLNSVQRLLNREYVGCLASYDAMDRSFNKSVPSRLSFCLRDIIPRYSLDEHVFMGLTACGQFLLSYTMCSIDNANTSNYSFNMHCKYTLYFWIYQPYKQIKSFYKCHLFDDHGVDNVKDVIMIQWKTADPRILIVHGAATEDNERSYLTYIKVPKLGCLDCKRLRDSENNEDYSALMIVLIILFKDFRRYLLCLKCNLTVHTKYSTIERKFDPYINVICPERILIISNGVFHMLNIRIEQASNQQQQQNTQTTSSIAINSTMPMVLLQPTIRTNSSSTACNHENHLRNLPTYAVDENQNKCSTELPTIIEQTTTMNIVDRIIEDFTDIETDSTHSGSGIHIPQVDNGHNILTQQDTKRTNIRQTDYENLFFKRNNGTGRLTNSNNNIVNNNNNNSNNSNNNNNNKNLSQTTPTRKQRIVTKSCRQGIYTFCSGSVTNIPNTAGTSASPQLNANNDKAAAYEFSEDNEKCEKISILRKRRLADRKYEFSEDNSENIIPFTKTRSTLATKPKTFYSSGNQSPRPNINISYVHNSPFSSPSTSPHSNPMNNLSSVQYELSRHCTTTARMSPMHLRCSSPLGFRSPPSTSNAMAAVLNNGSGGGNIRSPSRHLTAANIYYSKSPPQGISTSAHALSFKPPGALSPLQLSVTKRTHLEVRGDSMSPNSQISFLSPRRDDRSIEMPLLPGGAMSEIPVCTKKFQRRYVEEDDAASVITSEEDDCISPGYHTLLPMEVHGSCYTEMPMISKASYQQLYCTSVVIDQHSFDMETFSYYVISTLCQRNQKIYEFLYDWAHEIITTCPLTCTIFCLLLAHFACREHEPTCENCSHRLRCPFHERQCECCVLFTWNMVTGEWKVLDFGELYEVPKRLSNSRLERKTGCKPNSMLKVRPPLAKNAKRLAYELSQTLDKLPNYTDNLRVLDSNIKRTKASIVDRDNMQQFYLKRIHRND